MKTQWLNLVLALTNRIYQRKQAVISGVGLGIVGNIVVLFFLELILAIISLPLYLGLKPDKVSAYLRDKGGYEKITFDYSLRRILTLTGLGVVFLIWTVKLLLIILAPNLFGPMRLYQVSDLRPADILEQGTAAAETKIQTARIVDQMTRPELTKVEKNQNGDHVFSGIGQPQTAVVLVIADRQSVILIDKANDKGEWQVTQLQKDFKLSEGNHAVAAFSYDEKLGMRSNSSAPQYFKVKTTWLDQLVRNTDVFINFSILIVIGVGILLTVLTI